MIFSLFRDANRFEVPYALSALTHLTCVHAAIHRHSITERHILVGDGLMVGTTPDGSVVLHDIKKRFIIKILRTCTVQSPITISSSHLVCKHAAATSSTTTATAHGGDALVVWDRQTWEKSLISPPGITSYTSFVLYGSLLAYCAGTRVQVLSLQDNQVRYS